VSAYAHGTETSPDEVEPGFIAIIMTFVSLVFPLGFIFQEFSIPNSRSLYLASPVVAFPLSIPSFLYAYWIVRYYQNKSKKQTVYILGLLSIILPSAIMLVPAVMIGSLPVFYPIPLQFVAGIVILWRVKRPELRASESIARLELFGASPSFIAVLMTLVTLIVPLGYIPSGFLPFPFFWVGPFAGVYGLIWLFGPGFFSAGFYIFDPAILVPTLILGLFNVLFTLQLIRYYQGITTQKRVLLVGFASLAYPILLALSSTLSFLPYLRMQVVWPVPIQFIIALILLYRIPGPELVA
jgi:hypothetical protein